MQELNLEDWQDPSVIRASLAKKRIAVVGMSSKELRASYFVGFYLFLIGKQFWLRTLVRLKQGCRSSQ